MIDLTTSYDSILVRQAGIHANSIAGAHEKMEMSMRLGDEGATMAYAVLIAEQAQKVASVASWAMRREDT